MKLKKIVYALEQYWAYKMRLERDILDYKEYAVFDNDDENALRMKKQIEIDREVLGKFLDMEI